MKKNTFSPNHLQTWQTCQKKYFLKYIKNVNIPEKSDFFKLGKKVHTMVYYSLNGYDIEPFERVLSEDENKHWQNLKKMSLLKFPLVSCEWEFNVPVGGFWLNGVVDAIFYDESHHKYIIADWKTGKSAYDKEDFQQMIYMLALYRAQRELDLKIAQEDICFRYIKTNEASQSSQYSFSTDKEKEYELEILSFIKEISSTHEYSSCQTSEHCKFCPYRELC